MRLKTTEVIGAVVAIFVVGPVVWCALDQDPPMRVTAAEAEREPVPRGGSLHPRYRAIYLRRCSGEGQRVFVDATGHPMWIEPFQFRDGIASDGRPVALDIEKEMPPASAAVPYGAAPGIARYQNITHFFCNPLQKALRGKWGMSITFRYPVIDFTVADRAVPHVDPPKSIFAPVKDGSEAPQIIGDEAPPAPIFPRSEGQHP